MWDPTPYGESRPTGNRRPVTPEATMFPYSHSPTMLLVAETQMREARARAAEDRLARSARSTDGDSEAQTSRRHSWRVPGFVRLTHHHQPHPAQ